MSVSPVVDVNRPFRVWHMREIYDGPQGPGIYVPNVDDMVIDWNTGVWRVISVDHFETSLSYLVRINLANLSGGMDDSDYAIVTGVGANSNSFRIYVDTSVVPHPMNIDTRNIWNGSENASIKVFRGTDTNELTGTVISAVLNASNQVISENIPLETVVIPNATNITQKCARPAFCTETVTDGEVVMVVTYGSAGNITSIDKFVITTTNMIRSINQAGKYVSNIELLSPFLSLTNNRLIECPINIVTQSLSLRAKVTYSDGTSATYPIDGTKFALAGIQNYVASQIGQTVDLVLTYHLAPSELSLDATAALPDRRVVEEYKLKTVDIDTFYAIKLFAVPVWGTGSKYTLKWYLYNLERADIIDVTSMVEYGTNSPTFNGSLYNQAQNLNIAFNMQRLGSQYSYYRQVQNVSITLTNPATTVAANNYFTIGYSDSSLYGETVKAFFTSDELNAGKLKLNLSAGYSDSLTWITNVYRTLEPISYAAQEAEAPAPTHARIIVNSQIVREVEIGDITSDIRNISVGIAQGTSVRVELYAVDGEDTLELAVAPFVATAMV